MTTRTGDEWFKSAFSHDYIRIYQHRDHSEARQAVSDLLAFLGVPSGARCLDLCCGFGRHLDDLNGRGLNALGIDLSLDLLEHAPEGVRGRIAQADMRTLPFTEEAFDYVFSFFTSFGYFADDEQNLRVVREIARLLRPGGRVVFDFLNRDHVQANLVAEDTQELPEFTLRQRRWVDPDNNTVNKELRIIENGAERLYRERVKLYGAEDFQTFFDAAGLKMTGCHGTVNGTPLTPDSDRLIVLGEKT